MLIRKIFYACCCCSLSASEREREEITAFLCTYSSDDDVNELCALEWRFFQPLSFTICVIWKCNDKIRHWTTWSNYIAWIDCKIQQLCQIALPQVECDFNKFLLKHSKVNWVENINFLLVASKYVWIINSWHCRRTIK